MKKTFKITLLIIGALTLVFLIDYRVLTPRRILRLWTSEFNLDIMRFIPIVTKYEEKFVLCGDGYQRIEFLFNDKCEEYFVGQKLSDIKLLPKYLNQGYLWNTSHCYYIYKSISENDDGGYALLIINTETNKGRLIVEYF